ncbi:MAG: hypothetical protein H7Z72_06265 [Bacteroidetes bacterium]|nr:hypothetical protein [Fibrella sp.]
MNTHKTILVPTDFCVPSLNILRLALEEITEPRVNVVLLHCHTLDDSITERLFYSPARIIQDLMTDDFDEALSILRNRFENQIGELQIKLFHGHVQSVFDTLLDTLKIDAIYFSKSYRQHLSKRAFSATPYIVNGVIPYYELDLARRETSFERIKLENLFLN